VTFLYKAGYRGAKKFLAKDNKAESWVKDLQF